MKTSFDLTKADAVIDEYEASLSDPNQLPGKLGRTWLEFCMERHGLIPEARGVPFWESLALWFACLIVTKRVREVSRMERAIRTTKNAPTTEGQIRKLLSKKPTVLRDGATGQALREILAGRAK